MVNTSFGTGNAADGESQEEGLPEPPRAEGQGLFGDGSPAAAPAAARWPSRCSPAP